MDAIESGAYNVMLALAIKAQIHQPAKVEKAARRLEGALRLFSMRLTEAEAKAEAKAAAMLERMEKTRFPSPRPAQRAREGAPAPRAREGACKVCGREGFCNWITNPQHCIGCIEAAGDLTEAGKVEFARAMNRR